MSKRGNGKRLSTKPASRWSEVAKRIRLIGSRHTDAGSDFRCVAQNGHGAISDLSPLCAPKWAPPITLNLWGHAVVAHPPSDPVA